MKRANVMTPPPVWLEMRYCIGVPTAAEPVPPPLIIDGVVFEHEAHHQDEASAQQPLAAGRSSCGAVALVSLRVAEVPSGRRILMTRLMACASCTMLWIASKESSPCRVWSLGLWPRAGICADYISRMFRRVIGPRARARSPFAVHRSEPFARCGVC